MITPPALDALWREQFRARLARGESPTFIAEGHSMWPVIRAGAVVSIQALPHGGPPLGAVVLVAHRGRLVLHRVLARRAGAVLLKGDANPQSDGWCDLDWIVGGVAPRPWDRPRALLSRLTGPGLSRVIGFCRTRLC